MPARRSFLVACAILTVSACTGSDELPIGSQTLANHGTACTFPTDCETGICEDGICCAVACGVCSSCDPTGMACSVVPADDSACGTVDCDGLDTSCRNFADITTGRCEGAGNCKDPNTADCTAFTNAPATADCGTCSRCDGSGSCSTYDDTQDADCGACNECSGLGTCTQSAQGTPCGLCAQCNMGGVCNVAAADDAACGTISCSGLDTSCRDYANITTNRCEAIGDCKDANTADCAVFTNAGPGTDCGICAECNGTGGCTVAPADDTACGTVDCDGLDQACRDYTDLTANRCEGLNDCRDANTTDCSAFADIPAGNPCGNAPSLQDGFESGLNNWIVQAPWDVTNASAAAGTFSLTDSPGANYGNNVNATVTLATPVSLVGVISPSLSFSHRYNTQSSADFGRVEISTNGGGTWSILATYSGTVASFTPVTLSLAAYSGQPSVLIRFRFSSDASTVFDGWYIDSVVLNALTPLLCQACDGAGACSGGFLADDARCGSVECDGLDASCRNYADLTTNRCEGAAGCKDANTADCTAFTNSTPGEFCGACKGCDAAGGCTQTASAGTACGDSLVDGFEGGNTRFSFTGTWAPTNTSAATGTYSLTDSPGGNYLASQDTWAMTPTLDLAGATAPALRFSHRYSFDTSGDVARVEITTNGGATWTQLTSYTGTLASFTPVTISLTAYAGMPSVRLRFRFTTNTVTQNDGWYIDDVTVGDATVCAACDALGACSLPAADDAACGTIECDGLDVGCRDFTDLTASRCEGLGDCKDANAAADCTAFSDVPAGQPCGTGSGIQEGFESGTSQWTLQSPWGLSTNMPFMGTYSLHDSPAGNYANSTNVSATLTTPISLVGATSPTLTFMNRRFLETCCDRCIVEISTNGGSSWSSLATYSTNVSTWTAQTISLSAYVGQPSVLFRFRLTSDGSITSDGWYIDELAINASAAGALCHACDGAGACTMPMADDARCGVIDCDGLDSVCGSFNDLTTNRCESDGCKDPNTSDCTDFTAIPAGMDCGVCATCDGAGLCAADLTQNTDCSTCRQCTGVGSCGPQPSGSDLRNECTPGLCATGDCNGSGSCGISPSGTDCGVCASCSSGSCVANLAQDSDCETCRECTGMGACGFQSAGTDVKGECDSDPCLSGSCNGTGACGQLVDGSSCDQGLCTTGSTCLAGECGPPTSMVTCPPPAECWQAATCDPFSGECGGSPGPLPDGSGCDDGRACTLGDHCVGGTCVPLANNCPCASDADCVSLDVCHLDGMCDLGTSTCVYPNAPDGTDCEDGNACTNGEACLSGECRAATNVTCTALDTCHEPGTCDPLTGVCSNPRKPAGSACDDGRSCTTGDACEAGSCTPTASTCPCSSNADCFALGQCWLVGTCDLGTNLCSTPTRPDGEACDDADVCTTGEACQGGSCGSPATSTDCTARDACHLPGTCDPESGICDDPRAPDGTACPGGFCQFGLCLPPIPDAGVRADARMDGGTGGGDDGGCGCVTGGRGPSGGGWLALVGLGLFWLRRRRR